MFNTSLNNALTRANAKEIVGWGMPDYTSFVDFPIPYNNPYTIQANGWVVGYIVVAAGYFNNVFVNGVAVQKHASISFGTIFPVSKGDIVTTDAAQGNFYFMPCKE